MPGSLSPLQDRASIGAGGHPGVACQPSAGEASRAWLPGLAACGQLLVREPDRELAGGDVDVDDVAVAQQRDRTAYGCLGADVADRNAGGTAGKPAIGHQGTAVVQPHSLERRG